jgi:eukaryotic-like serine/threonine-protein kinase
MDLREKAFVKALLAKSLINFQVAEELATSSAEGKPVWDQALELGHIDQQQHDEILQELGQSTESNESNDETSEQQDAAKPQEQSSKQGMLGGYQLLEKLDRGSMGVVYRAKQVSLDRIVALKVLPRSLAKAEGFAERFLREAKAAGQLNHENIVHGIDVGEAGGYYYFAMEFVEGANLGKRLTKDKFLHENQGVNFCRQIASALEHAHAAGVLHRDIKPDNIIISGDNIAKLCDLGLAVRSSVADTDNKNIVGTPSYISPEQVEGKTPDQRSDIYQLGATLYHLLTGKPPFEGATPLETMRLRLIKDPTPAQECRPGVSRAAGAVVAKMMARKPEDRYDKATALIGDLDKLISGGIPSALTQSMADRRRARKTGRDGTRQTRSRAAGMTRGTLSVPGARNTAATSPLPRARRRKGFPVMLVMTIAGMVALAILGKMAFNVFGTPASSTTSRRDPKLRPDPGDKALSQKEKTTRHLLGLLDTLQSRERKNPGQGTRILEQYKKLLAQARGTGAEEQVRSAVEQAMGRLGSLDHKADLAATNKARNKALAAGDYLEAVRILKAFANRNKDFPDAKTALKNAEEIRRRSAEMISAALKQADQALATGDYGTSLGLLRTISAKVKSAEGLKAVPAKIKDIERQLVPAFNKALAQLLKRAQTGDITSAAIMADKLADRFKGTLKAQEAADLSTNIKRLPEVRARIISAAKGKAAKDLTFMPDAPLLGGVNWKIKSVTTKGVNLEGLRGDLPLKSRQPWANFSGNDVYHLFKMYVPTPSQADHSLLAAFCAVHGMKAQSAEHRRKAQP